MSQSILLLVVEDDVFIGTDLEDTLKEAGFDVLLVSNGESALAELERDGDKFRAVITDIRLGKGPNGWDIGRRAREIVSNQAVVYMSGDSSTEWSS